ncbi:MAG: hypothetical protein KC910_09975 [Candidatus Eremiobacteraeota bacterium]|nr:hypothetical protein [Candidatus Eremiobacteraeota bacterium]
MVTQSKTVEDLRAAIDARIESCRHFASGRIDSFGRVVGVGELPDSSRHERQDHQLDAAGRVLRLDRYEREFSKPTRRYYHYLGDSDKVSESVWFDRYGRLENIHRYLYDRDSGLMLERAEYTREGALYYRILSSYGQGDTLAQDLWLGPDGKQLKRYVYTYEDGELVREEHYGKADGMVGYFEMEYDQGGNLALKAWFSGDRLQSLTAYEYDQENRVIETVLADGDEMIEARQTFGYDQVGNVVEECWFDSHDQLVKHLRYGVDDLSVGS